MTDIIFTLFLCRTGYYLEANFFMKPIINNEVMSLLVKLILPAFLLLFLYFRMKSATNSQLKKSNFYVLSILLVYTFINFSHLFWIFYYIYFI
ncbi:DUF5658 family protein [Clostridium sp. SHJSY1]|nr:DUF5658 family protein [Clostridium sp. SHJSY1]